MAIPSFAAGYVSPAQLNALVDAVNAATADTGWQTITNTNAGYNVGVAQYRIKRNNELQVRLSLTRKTGTVTLNETVAVLPSGTYPTATTTTRIPFMSGTAGAGWLAIDSATGNLNVVSLVGTAANGILTSPAPVPLD